MRPIDADAIPYTMLYKENFLKGTGFESRGAWKADIDAMPTIQPQRKKGEWIWDDEGYHCSECWHHTYGNTGEVLSGVYKFCPNCGAEMEGEE